MPTSTATITLYESFLYYGAINAFNWSTNSIVMGLCTSSYTPSASTHETLSDITNEVSGGGYARQTLANGSYTYSSSDGGIIAELDPPTFSGTGSGFTARYWFMFNDSITGDPLIAYGLIDNASGGTDVTVGASQDLTIEGDGTGGTIWFRFASS